MIHARKWRERFHRRRANGAHRTHRRASVARLAARVVVAAGGTAWSAGATHRRGGPVIAAVRGRWLIALAQFAAAGVRAQREAAAVARAPEMAALADAAVADIRIRLASVARR